MLNCCANPDPHADVLMQKMFVLANLSVNAVLMATGSECVVFAKDEKIYVVFKSFRVKLFASLNIIWRVARVHL